MKKLLEMLTYRRPAGGVTDVAFRDKFIMCDPRAKLDSHDNIVLEVGENSRTIFSCHTDTVHNNEGTQVVLADVECGMAYKDDKQALGADDTAGCWLLLEMIAAEVPGVYMFHFGEERGCIGSRAKAKAEPDWFKRFNRAIAFDRRGIDNIITHQSPGRGCSESFAEALALELNEAHPGFAYAPDDTGSVTDTASYFELVPECTNVSVGYEGEHGGSETLDIFHLMHLAKAAIRVDWEGLPTDRDPAVHQDDRYYSKGGKYSFASIDPMTDEDEADFATMSRAGEIFDEYEDDFDCAIYAARMEQDAWAAQEELAEWKHQYGKLLQEVTALRAQLRLDAKKPGKNPVPAEFPF